MLHFNYNGKWYKENTPVIGVDNRGLRYGDGLFETMKYANGKLVLADEHFARLWKGMALLQFEVPKHFTPQKLEEEILQLLNKNGHEKNARVRLTILRGDGGLYDAVNHFPNYSIQSWPLPEDNGKWNSNGLVIGIYEDAKKSCDRFCNIKHNNYLPYVMGALYAKQQKWNDAVILNTEGNICDTTIANLFFIKEEIIYTPALSEGCVAGILRKVLINTLKQEGYTVIEKNITEEELLAADEVFLTNSIYNIRWVQRIGDKRFTNSFTQKIYQAVLPTIS